LHLDNMAQPTQLDQLKALTVVVADSGDFHSFEKLKVRDATTNPSLIFQAAGLPQYQHLVQQAIEAGKKAGGSEAEQLEAILDKLAVTFGSEILKIIPGRVSTEIDARLSFNTEATLHKARHLAQMYKDIGVNPQERVLFKIASTWEGLQAAKILEAEGLHCNLTLLFSFAQAVVAADNGITLISPFVGRILDYWKKETGKDYAPEADPGVISVTEIYNYYRKHGHKTIVMGASFRSKAEVLQLAGCDYLTIAPKFLQELADSTEKVEKKLDGAHAKSLNLPKRTFDEKAFRWALNEDPCATNKLAEGIRLFAADTVKLEQLIQKQLKA